MKNRKYYINDMFFKVWSSNMAYVLGLWWADGHISVKQGTFNITQKKDEFELLTDVSRTMDSTYSIKTYGNCVVLRARSDEIISDILLLCCDKYKKDARVVLPFIPEKYISDFIRGLWDGDGGICSFKYKDRPLFYRSYLASANLEFLLSIKEILHTRIGTKGCISTRTQYPGEKVNGSVLKKTSTVYQLTMGINDTRRMRDFLYKNKSCIKMKRKYNMFFITGEIRKSGSRTFLNFDDAKKIVKTLNIKSKTQWFSEFKDKNIKGIPVDPYTRYKNSGWVNWADWLSKPIKIKI